MKNAFFLLFLFIGTYVQAQQPPQQVNVGTAPNSGNGDNLRSAFTKLNTNDAAAFDSFYYAKQVVEFVIAKAQVKGDTITDYQMVIPEALSGYNLVRAELYHGTIAGDRTPTANIWRKRSSAEVSVTSTGANYTTRAVINISNDDMVKDDLLGARVTFGSGTTYPSGLFFVFTFQRP